MQFAALLLLLVSMVAAGALIIKHNRIFWGKTEIIQSKILGETRRVRVFLPASYNKSAPIKQQYPVIYLFDGNAHCRSAIGMLKQLREENSNATSHEMIVVAIKNPDRARDFTPTNSLIGPDGNKLEMLKNSGGSGEFIAFIEKELIPHIESAYPAAPDRTVIGHSLGGLAVMNFLIHHTEIFDVYVAIEPSIWWDDKKLLDEARMKFKDKNFSGISLFLAVANTMSAGMDITQAKNDTTASTNHIRSLLKLIDILDSNPGNGLRWQHKYYPDKDHDSVVSPGMYDALHFLLDNKANDDAGSSHFVKNR